ncbi:hypothetical protein Tco_1121020 [Tanacetum coccineum]|uniref:Reverse transcriptase domain-containing protein n=1 Tax=Tanacetum coccineum TaxID=301880 RepID=A0ABQ5IWI7_9ASTR
MEAFIRGLPRSIEGNITALKPQTLEGAITITQRLMDQVTKHDAEQGTNDHKRKFNDRRNNINNYPNNHGNNNYPNNRNNNNITMITTSSKMEGMKPSKLMETVDIMDLIPCVGSVHCITQDLALSGPCPRSEVKSLDQLEAKEKEGEALELVTKSYEPKTPISTHIQDFNTSCHVTFDEYHIPYSSFHSTPSTSEYDVFVFEDTPLVTPGLVPLPPFAGGVAPDLSHVEPTSPLVLASNYVPPSLLTHPIDTRSQTGSLKPVYRLVLTATTAALPLPRSTTQAMCDPNWKTL